VSPSPAGSIAPALGLRAGDAARVIRSQTKHPRRIAGVLDGGAGLDWYFAHLKGQNLDTVIGQISGEVVTGI
jgi:hypothetical protein